MARALLLLFIVLPVAAWSGSAQRGATEPAAVTVAYVANAGMLVSLERRRFLIDAPIRDGIPPYAVSSAEERSRLETGRPPYDRLDAILITHWHEDHFSPEAVAGSLVHNRDAVFVSSPEVVERLRRVAPTLAAERLHAVLPKPGQAQELRIGGVPVRVLRIRHNPARRTPEQHVGFLIGEATTVLHVGDADPIADNFALMRDLPKVDLALLPFWYVLDAEGRAFVSRSLRPRRIVAMHIPPDEAAQVAARLRAAQTRIVVAESPGSTLVR